MTEEWRSLKGLVENGDYYEASNFGGVRSISRVTTNGKKLKGKILSQKKEKGGYLAVNLYLNNNIKYYQAHRLVAIAFIDNYESKPEVNHKDGVKTNNHIYNLEWSTEKENIKHAVETGLFNTKGESNPNAKINKNDVIKIRELYASGNYTLKEIGEIFNIAFQTISAIVNKKRWKHI
jgi:hypothetical protein